MLLTITNTSQPVSRLGYLMHKHPDKWQTFDLSFGKAHVFYPINTNSECSIALLIDIDPIELIRNKKLTSNSFALRHYVNDRPYVASSFTAVAINKVFRSALAGNCKDKPEAVGQSLELTVKLSCVSAKGGAAIIEELFQPLGYQLVIEPIPLDEKFPEWERKRYFSLELKHCLPLKEVLRHLYVLIPVLDSEKHYFISNDEVDKLVDKAGEWLPNHPKKDLITKRYFSRQRSFIKEALDRLVDQEGLEENEESKAVEQEVVIEQSLSLHQQRLALVAEKIKSLGAKTVVDVGCGEGKLIKLLLKESIKKVVGMDVSTRALEMAHRKLYLDRMTPLQRDRIQLIQGGLTYKDKRLEGFDAMACVEVIEHLDEPRLAAFKKVVFQYSKPKAVIITTPNQEYNVIFESLPTGTFRHKDHRFEWTREQFETWGDEIAEDFDYNVDYFPIGSIDDRHGAPSQMALFTKI